MKATTLILILERVGWIEVRRQGSHRIFQHPQRAILIAVPDIGEQVLSLGLLNDIFKEAQVKTRVVRVPSPLKLILNFMASFGLIKKRYR